MNHQNILYNAANSPLMLNDLIYLLDKYQSSYVFIKDRRSRYHHANSNFLKVMGLTSKQQLIGKDDHFLYAEKSKVSMYQAHDQQALEEGNQIVVNGSINPVRQHALIKEMEGTLLPIYHKNDRPEYVLGIFQAKEKLLCLSWENIFKISNQELQRLLRVSRYKVKIRHQTIGLSRREIQLIINLMKGLHAGEIAEELNIKQTTIESYFVNLKNKLGVNTKREIVALLAHDNFLEQIFL